MPKVPTTPAVIPPVIPRRTFFTKDAKLSHKFAAAAPAPGVDAEPGQATVSGYCCVWGAVSTDRGGYKVRLLKGSPKIAPQVLATYHHDGAAILGNTANSTLRFSADDVGLHVEMDLPDTACAEDVAELIDQKYVQGMSFHMGSKPVGRVVMEGGEQILEVASFLLDEVAITGDPAFIETSVAVSGGDFDMLDPECDDPLDPECEDMAAKVYAEKVKMEQLQLDMLTI